MSSDSKSVSEFEEHKQEAPWDLLSDDVKALLQSAEDCMWPFLPEKWQYAVGGDLEDRRNLKEIITSPSKVVKNKCEIDILHECLQDYIHTGMYARGSAILFLIDRFAYWQGASSSLLKIAKKIATESPQTPIAPQIVIRRARVLISGGDLQTAEKILTSLISSGRELSIWTYKTDDQYDLVKAVCTQIIGQIKLKLGLWKEAAHLMMDSIIMFRELNAIDKKGISSSLGLLVDILANISPEDYDTVKVKYNLKETSSIDEAFNCGIEAAKLSPFTTLFQSRHFRRAGGVLMQALSDDISDKKRLETMTTILRVESTSIICLTKTEITSLGSKEQLYELIAASHIVAQVLDKCKMKCATEMLKHVAVLFLHFCKSDSGSLSDTATTHVHELCKTAKFINRFLHGERYITESFGFFEGYLKAEVPQAGPAVDCDRSVLTLSTIDSDTFVDSISWSEEDRQLTKEEDIVETEDPSASTETRWTEDDYGVTFDPSADTVEMPDLDLDQVGKLNLEDDPGKLMCLLDQELSRVLTLHADWPDEIQECAVYKFFPQENKWVVHNSLLHWGERLQLSEGKEGKQRDPYFVKFITQEEPSGVYVGKSYKPEKLRNHPEAMVPNLYKQDVRCQAVARNYVQALNSRLELVKGFLPWFSIHQIQYLPSVYLQLRDQPFHRRFLNVEPFIEGNFLKISNNYKFMDEQYRDSICATLSHFSYDWSDGMEMVVDLQGWVAKAEGDIYYLTDPQIHSEKGRGKYGRGNLASEGIAAFFLYQHKTCNSLCKALRLKRPKRFGAQPPIKTAIDFF